jgi:hypothetical protein
MIDDAACGAAGGKKKLAGETEEHGENLSQCHFIHHKISYLLTFCTPIRTHVNTQ